jgi:hypothetical protein
MNPYNNKVEPLTIEEITRCVKQFKPDGVGLYTYKYNTPTIPEEEINMFDLCDPWKIKNDTNTDPVDKINYYHTYLSLFLDRTIQAVTDKYSALIIDYGHRISVEYVERKQTFEVFYTTEEGDKEKLTKDQLRTQVIRFVLEIFDEEK